MKRHYDWQLRLEAFARERRALPFAWGGNDCALFAADAVQALTGERLLPQLRTHASARAALRTLRAQGGLRAIATAALGAEIAPAFATVGDLVLLRVGKREALAVCNGGSAIGPGPGGLAALPMADAITAWRVG